MSALELALRMMETQLGGQDPRLCVPLLGSESWLCRDLLGVLKTSHLTSPCISLPTYKMGLIILYF